MSGDDHRRFFFGAQIAEQLDEGAAGFDVQAGGGFIEEQHGRLMEQAAGDFDAAARAGREGTHKGTGVLGEVHARQEDGGTAAARLRGEAVEPGEKIEILGDGEIGIGRECLRNVTDGAADGGRVAQRVVSTNAGGAFGGRE